MEDRFARGICAPGGPDLGQTDLWQRVPLQLDPPILDFGCGECRLAALYLPVCSGEGETRHDFVCEQFERGPK